MITASIRLAQPDDALCIAVLEAEHFTASRGASLLWLTAWVGNPRALAFYPRLGYAEMGRTAHVFEGESYENRLFGKPLQA